MPCWGRFTRLWGDLDRPQIESVNSILYRALVEHGGMTPEEVLCGGDDE